MSSFPHRHQFYRLFPLPSTPLLAPQAYRGARGLSPTSTLPVYNNASSCKLARPLSWLSVQRHAPRSTSIPLVTLVRRGVGERRRPTGGCGDSPPPVLYQFIVALLVVSWLAAGVRLDSAQESRADVPVPPLLSPPLSHCPSVSSLFWKHTASSSFLARSERENNNGRIN